MILSALCDYYDLLSKIHGSVISPYGYEKVTTSYAAILSEDGALQDILSLKQLNENRPQIFTMPKSLKNSSISASPVCDNFEYIFGTGGEKGKKEITANKFEAAKKLHLEMFEDAVSLEAIAIRRFFENWDINKAFENESILKHYSEKGKAFSGNIVFRLSGKLEYFHENPEIVDIWQKHNEETRQAEEQIVSQCSVSGKVLPIARLHKKLQGVKDASTMGASLVCFNKDSDESYGLFQSRNSAVSEQAAFKYTTVLQYMLSGREQRMQIGDATTVFWAGKADNSYIDIFNCLLSEPDELAGEAGDESEGETIIEDVKTREIVKTILKDGVSGVYNNSQLDPTTNFYVLGLSPNAGRISVRFFYRDSFESFCEKIKQHYDDIAVYGGKNGREHIKVWILLNATISSKSKDKKVNPLLGGAVARAMLTGEMYPRLLLSQTIIRVKAETEITQARAAIIKGYLVRKNRLLKKEEELTMYLNEKSANPAYVLGRTFAILEMIQKNALGVNINATIKDKYFASACSNPSLVFPNLLKLAQHHLAKIEGPYWNIQLSACLGLLEVDSFPKNFNMESQGRFILGYYQQNEKNYEARPKKEEENKDGK
jgi:CRISPR-associated protein Csd1